jgi:hypothetical protein
MNNKIVDMSYLILTIIILVIIILIYFNILYIYVFIDINYQNLFQRDLCTYLNFIFKSQNYNK